MPLQPPAKPQSEHSRSVFRNSLDGETAYQRHQRYVRMVQSYGEHLTGESLGVRRTDFDVLKDAHRFLRNDGEDEANLTYDDSIALKYYRSLFKEFAICDLKHYKSGNFSLRWRTEDEVVDGIGQFTCGNPRCSRHTPEGMKKKEKTLITLELPFGYSEDGATKSALVKVVLCGRCKKKLTWKRDQEKEAAVKVGTIDVVSDGDDDKDPEGPHIPLRSEHDPPPSHHGQRDEHRDTRRSRRHTASPPRRSASPPRRS